MADAIKNRYDFVLLFDVKDGNPNGDPDAGNLPRTDPETGNGLVTDVCLKRKVRDYVILAKGSEKRFDVWVKAKSLTLNEQIERAYNESPDVKKALEVWQAWQKDKKKSPKPERHYEDIAKDWMCDNFYDIRTFGAVMSTSDRDNSESDGTKSKIKKTAGQVRGPIQLTFARSINQVVPLEHSIAVTAARKADKSVEEQIGIQGRKYTISYGLYRCHGFVSAPLAEQTGFSEEDLSLFWEALLNMFEHDHSAALGYMATRKLIIYKHDSAMGNTPAHVLFDKVEVTAKTSPVRDFSEYEIKMPAQSEMPQGVSIIEKL
ncbi:MAG: type I-C CRISPR-associated protein Cas7/Csd2 [Calditrichota bacterium]